MPVLPRLPRRCAAVLLTSLVLGAPAAAQLAVGDPAPDFVLAGSDGRPYSLRGLLSLGGRDGIVLAWFPKAFTPGCRAELLSLRDSEPAFESLDVAVFMVSLDPPERNRAFAESVGAGLPLLSDPEGEAARAYGVLSPSGATAQRWTFVIDREGVVRHVDRAVEPRTHGTDLIGVLRSLGLARDPESPPEGDESD